MRKPWKIQRKVGPVWYEILLDMRCLMIGVNVGDAWWPCVYVHVGPIIVGAFWKGREETTLN